MALNQHVEWDMEEVAAGYDLSSIYEGLDENSTVPVTSSVLNNTAQAGPAINITSGLSNLLMGVVEQVVEMVSNTTTNLTTITPTPVAPSTSRKKWRWPAVRRMIPPIMWRRRYSNQYFNKIFAGHASYVSRYRVKI